MFPSPTGRAVSDATLSKLLRELGVSWLNLIERFYADLTQDVVRSGSFGSVRELVQAIEAYLVQRNESPQPYRWKASGGAIPAKIRRARAALEEAT